jgi:hypothetical protein
MRFCARNLGSAQVAAGLLPHPWKVGNRISRLPAEAPNFGVGRMRCRFDRIPITGNPNRPVRTDRLIGTGRPDGQIRGGLDVDL